MSIMASNPPPPPDEGGTTEGETIIVTGTRYREAEYDPGTGGDPGTGVSGGGDTGSGGGGGGIEPLETDCVAYAPDGASLHDINREALKIANAIQNMDVENYEYGALIFTLGGQPYSTRIFTQKNSDNVGVPLDVLEGLPNGANIVAFVHNHTSVGTSSDTSAIPSKQDFQIFEALWGAIRDNGIQGVSVDQNSLIYVHGRVDTMGDEPNKTRVYDRGDRGDDDPECSLQ